MGMAIKWLRGFFPIVIYEDNQILGYQSGCLYKVNANGDLKQVCKMPVSFVDRIKESNRLFARLFRSDIKASCITESGEVYFFKNKTLYRYNDTTRMLMNIVSVPQDKSTPLNIAPALKDSGWEVLWGDYFSNENRKEVVIWGLTKDTNIKAVYRFPSTTIRHIHNIVRDVAGNGYYIFTGDNDEKAGIYYADSCFEYVVPVYVGKKKARAVQGFCIKGALLYATDLVSQRNYICILRKNDNKWEQKKIFPLNGSCIYACSKKGKVFFSTTVESPEIEGRNRFWAMLSTERGKGILTNKVELISIDNDLNVKCEMKFEKDSFPYKLFQYGVITFPASHSEKLVIYPIGVKKYDGQVGVVEDCEGKNKPFVVVGMGPSGLFLVRQLHNVTEKIYAIGRHDDVGMYSKYIKKDRRYYAQNEETVFNALKNISDIEPIKPVVYLCSDQYLTMFANSLHDWSKVCNFSGANITTLKLINNKEKINLFCSENKINIPETIDMDSFCSQNEKKFPVIIKWKEKRLESRSNPIGKFYMCATKEQFDKLLIKLNKSWVSLDMLLVQPFIEGNNNFQYSVGGFYKNGTPLAFTTVKQIRQYPQGISALVYTVNDDISKKIEKIVFGLAKQFDFSGFLETEFKIDKDTGEIYLLDVNPRPWGWVSILGEIYPDFYRVLDDDKPVQEKQKTVWISPVRKLLSRSNPKNVDVDINFVEYKKAFDIYDKDDTLPNYMIYAMAIKKIIKRRLL